jgi:hypothetical protein
MKKISLLFAFTALFVSFAFAGTNDEKVITSKSLAPNEEVVPFKEAKCTVSVSWPNGTGGTTTLTINSSCDSPTCTTQSACDAAYAIISVIVPG